MRFTVSVWPFRFVREHLDALLAERESNTEHAMLDEVETLIANSEMPGPSPIWQALDGLGLSDPQRCGGK